MHLVFVLVVFAPSFSYQAGDWWSSDPRRLDAMMGCHVFESNFESMEGITSLNPNSGPLQRCFYAEPELFEISWPVRRDSAHPDYRRYRREGTAGDHVKEPTPEPQTDEQKIPREKWKPGHKAKLRFNSTAESETETRQKRSVGAKRGTEHSTAPAKRLANTQTRSKAPRPKRSIPYERYHVSYAKYQRYNRLIPRDRPHFQNLY